MFYNVNMSVVLVAISIVILVLAAPQMHGDYIVSKVGSQVVKLLNPKNHKSGGTGFSVVAPSGRLYTLTNGHVCELGEKEKEMHGAVPGTERFYRLRILDISNTTDLCLLEAMPGYSGVDLARYSDLGEEVAAIGHPQLMPLTISRGRLIQDQTIDVVFKINTSKEECQGDNFKFIDMQGTPLEVIFGVKNICVRSVKSTFTNIISYPGNSGSPVVNFWGNLVGVVFAGDTNTHFSFIIPLVDIKEFLSIY